MSYPYTPVVPSFKNRIGFPRRADNLLGRGDLTADAWGNQRVSIAHSMFHGLWTFDVNRKMYFIYENGTQVYTSTDITSTNGALQLLTTATKHTLLVESRECPRYQPNRGHVFSTALICPNKTNDGIREWGFGTQENRLLFRLKSDGLLYAVVRSGDVQICEEEIDVSGLDGFDVEKGNIYDIQMQWRGVGNFYFYINLTLVHVIENLGVVTALSIQNPAMPVRIAAQRTTQDVKIILGCVDITSENGEDADKEQYESAYASAVSVNGTAIPVIVVRNPLQISSKTNTRTITLARVSVTCSKKALFRVWSTRDSTAVTTPTYRAIGNGSYVECDSTDMNATAVRATASDSTKMHFITALPVEAAITRQWDNPYRGRIEFPIVRGDYIVVTCTATTATADVTVEWGEQI